jgi:hypothetical protein
MNRCGFSCPIRTQKTKNLSRIYLQGEIVQGTECATTQKAMVLFRDCLELQSRIHGPSF